MSAPTATRPAGPGADATLDPTGAPAARRASTRTVVLLVLLGVLAAVCLLSLAWGARDVPLGTAEREQTCQRNELAPHLVPDSPR